MNTCPHSRSCSIPGSLNSWGFPKQKVFATWRLLKYMAFPAGMEAGLSSQVSTIVAHPQLPTHNHRAPTSYHQSCPPRTEESAFQTESVNRKNAAFTHILTSAIAGIGFLNRCPEALVEQASHTARELPLNTSLCANSLSVSRKEDRCMGCSGGSRPWVWIPTPPPSVALDKSLDLSEPLLPHLCNAHDIRPPHKATVGVQWKNKGRASKPTAWDMADTQQMQVSLLRSEEKTRAPALLSSSAAVEWNQVTLRCHHLSPLKCRWC